MRAINYHSLQGMLVNITSLQAVLPARVKFALKPNYPRLFPNRLMVIMMPTYRCNYRCSYCMIVTKHDYTEFFPKAGEKTAAEWINALEKLPPALIYFQGGEPFL